MILVVERKRPIDLVPEIEHVTQFERGHGGQQAAKLGGRVQAKGKIVTQADFFSPLASGTSPLPGPHGATLLSV